MYYAFTMLCCCLVADYLLFSCVFYYVFIFISQEGRANEKYVTGYDDYGNPIYGDHVNDSTLSRDADGSMIAPAGHMDGR